MGKRAIVLFILYLSIVQNDAGLIEARKVLHIPEKIIGGMIDIVQSHKSKPVPTTTQGPVQNQPVHHSTLQYTWNPSGGYSNGYQGQGQFQGQGQYANYGMYPTGYPQTNYPVNSGHVYPNVQQGFATQGQTQEQYQVYPQGQGTQFQGQNQQVFDGNNQQTQFQGQQSGFNGHRPQNQFQGQNQVGQYGNGQFQGNGQYQGQNQNFQGQQTQNGQFTTQNVQNGPFIGGNQQTSQFVSHGQQGQFPGQYLQQGQGFSSGQVQESGHWQNGIWQNGSFQATGTQQPVGAGPTCVCHALTKPRLEDGSGKSEGDVKSETSI